LKDVVRLLSYSNLGTSQEREGEIQGFAGIGTESTEYPGNSQFYEGETLQIQAVIPGIQLNGSLLCSTIDHFLLDAFDIYITITTS
jgi:hypothetical protein